MKKFAKVFAVAAACAALTGSVAAFAGCGGSAESITITGSSSVTPLMEKLAAAYEEDHDVRITVSQSSSGAGVTDTIAGNNDFGMASRAVTSDEMSQGVKGETLCNDGISLVVGKNCTASNITTAEVKALYSDNTPACGGVITAAVGRDEGSGTRDFFDEHFELDGYNSKVGTQAETGNVIETISNTTNSVGYISYGSLGSNSSRIKALSLDGVECTLENLKNGSYVLCRPFVIVLSTSRELSEAAQGFYDYIMSDAAQSVISAEGYISIK